MRIKEIEDIMQEWAPPEIAWERDNVGLQVGNAGGTVSGILACLDVTPAVVREARKRGANLIVSHHPLLFRSLQAVTSGTPHSALVMAMVQQGISLYSAHTNMDFVRGGTSFALASLWRLRDTDFLLKSYHVDRKIVTFVSAEHADAVAGAMAKAGAGIIGRYEQCSFRTEGTGTFWGGASTRPSVGRKGRLERVPEIRIEMIAPRWRVGRVVAALKRAHPYEEVAYDIYPTENTSNDFGMGVIGTLARPVAMNRFLAMVKRSLGAEMARFVPGKRQMVQRIAACGGSGAELLDEAIRQNADAFVTADVKYHSFADARGRITLVDAGHFETEYPLVPVLARRLQTELRKRGERIHVFVARTSENPVHCV
jgi:dinuclear metal center YbgI/SA1388 family protein